MQKSEVVTMIQDIFPHKLNNWYDADARIGEQDFVFFFNGTKLLMKKSEGKTPIFPTGRDFGTGKSYIYLFSVDEERYFLLNEEPDFSSDFAYTEIFTLRSMEGAMPLHRIYAAMTGKHLSDWYRDTRFCGRCGSKTEHSQKERARLCPVCGYTAYPRIMPAVIVGVTNGDHLLLTKYRTGFRHYALIAGFTEIGETLEETVAREVMEEAGIRVKNIRYYKSQPWGIANDILMGYFCDVDGCTDIHMDTQELKFACWVHRDEIELQPDQMSLTNEMMQMFKLRKE